MKLFSFPFCFFLFFASIQLPAQNLSRLDVQFQENGSILKYGTIGGLKSPQFSEVDLDNDGDKDLFVFDKAGNVILTFRNDGQANVFDYTFAPGLRSKFPPLVHWAIMRDYNGDGAMDIFAQLNSGVAQGIEVWTGRWEGNKLAFDKVAFPQLSIGAIPVPSSNGNYTQLFVSTEDIPAFEDIDKDGDLDILTFGPVGGVVYLFQNMSVENGNGIGGLEYELADNCWGNFFESGISGCLELSSDPNECSEGFSGGADDRSGAVHAGSTLCLLDSDGDEDMDLVLGDLAFNNLILAVNGGTLTDAYINDQDCSYPNYNTPLEQTIFPAAYFVDVDNDEKRDLLVSPNTENSGEDLNGVWFYKNIGEDDTPNFALQKKNLFLDEMWDGGRGANPALVDYNADGLLDLVVGNHGYFISGGGRDSRLQLFLNTGTKAEPVFELEDNDWLGFGPLFITTASIYNFAPTFADMDGDEDLDLLVGDNSGRLIYAENTAGPNETMAFGNPEYNWMGLKAGQLTVPTVADVNRDGLLDIILGEKNVNSGDEGNSSFNLFVNKGTATEPFFDPDQEADGNTAFFGKVITQDLGFTSGQSAPAIWDTGSDFIMFSGSTSGKIKVFTDIEDNLEGTFTTYSENYGNVRTGIETRLAVNDINGDGILDMVIGNKRGGLEFFVSEFNTDGTVATKEIPALEGVTVYPNPAEDYLFIENETRFKVDALLYDAAGRLIRQWNVEPGKQQFDAGQLTMGVYFLKMQSKEGLLTEKIIIQ